MYSQLSNCATPNDLSMLIASWFSHGQEEEEVEDQAESLCFELVHEGRLDLFEQMLRHLCVPPRLRYYLACEICVTIESDEAAVIWLQTLVTSRDDYRELEKAMRETQRWILL